MGKKGSGKKDFGKKASSRGKPGDHRVGGQRAGGTGIRRLLFAGLALLVVASFVARRTGLVPDRTPAFDPADFADAPVVEAVDAAGVVGRDAVVCGTVANTVFASATGGQPTYLNLERAYPEQPFDAVIWGRDRERFQPPPELAYLDRRVCVAGRVTTHQGTPRIEVASPEQIRVDPSRTP